MGFTFLWGSSSYIPHLEGRGITEAVALEIGKGKNDRESTGDSF